MSELRTVRDHQAEARRMAQAGRADDALAALRAAEVLAPDDASVQVDLAMLSAAQDAFELAATHARRAVEIDASLPQPWLVLGIAALEHRHDPAEAIRWLDGALERAPDLLEAHFNRAVALSDLHRYAEAIDGYRRVLKAQPKYSPAWLNLGNALQESGEHERAVEAYDAALAVDARQADVLCARGYSLRELGKYRAAVNSFERCLAVDPDFISCRGLKLHTRLQMCDWAGIDDEIAEITRRIELGQCPSSPFYLQAFIESPALLRRATEQWVKVVVPPRDDLGPIPPRSRPKRLRVAYCSPDFRDHPVGRLIAGVIEAHDRNGFEIFGVSFGPDTQDSTRKRLQTACEHFVDVRTRSDREIAEFMRENAIDVAIDLAGYTRGARPGIFAFRAAPIQMGYLGYLGTMGAPYFDYILADPTLVLEEHHDRFAEKVAYLPVYHGEDSARLSDTTEVSRTSLGIAEDAFVFCCFNNNYKFSSQLFTIWMRILQRVEGSTLMISVDSSDAASNLRRQAASAGISAKRVVLLERVPYAQYLGRLRLADLFLDTYPYGAGTTAGDAIEMGVPVLTCSGATMTSRIGASLATFGGTSESVASRFGEYEELAVSLAQGALRHPHAKSPAPTTRTDVNSRIARGLESMWKELAKRAA